MPSLDTLPFDALFLIISVVAIEDIFHLRHTCTKLFKLTEERSIWRLAVRDIADIIPSSRIDYHLISGSVEQLRECASRTINVNKVFRERVVWFGQIPRLFPMASAVPQLSLVDAKIVPGGEWVLLLYQNGKINLHNWEDLSGPPVSVATIPIPGSADEIVGELGMQLSFSSTGVAWAMIIRKSKTHDHPLDYFYYRIDVVNGSIQMVSSASRRGLFVDATTTGDLSAVLWEEANGFSYIELRKPVSANLMNGMENCTVFAIGKTKIIKLKKLFILCPHMILISDDVGGQSLISVPEFRPIEKKTQTVTQNVGSLLQKFDSTADKGLRNALCPHHMHTLPILPQHNGFLIYSPPPADLNDRPPQLILPAHVAVEGDITSGAGQIFWPGRGGTEGCILLHSCDQYIKPRNHIGYTRLGISARPQPMSVKFMPLPYHPGPGNVHTLSCDGDSGKICLMYTAWNEDNKKVLLIDLLAPGNYTDAQLAVMGVSSKDYFKDLFKTG